MFDPSAPHIIILVVVVLLLFGSSRLPGAARSLGKSMHIFRRSVQGLDTEDTAANPAPGMPGATALPPAPALDPTQQQLADLQRQVDELQRQSATSGNGQAGQSQTHQPL
jgi:sec-independent protein translocase protein TatA